MSLKGLADRRVFAGVMTAIGIGLTIYLGVLSGAQQPPSRATSALLVVLAGIFQLLGAALFGSSGKADPTLTRASVRRLIKMGYRAKAARERAEATFEFGNAADLRKAMGEIGVHLSWLEEGILDAIGDWREFHGSALKKLDDEAEKNAQN